MKWATRPARAAGESPAAFARVYGVKEVGLARSGEASAEEICFRALAHADLPMLHEWMTRTHVRLWWEEGGQTYAEFAPVYAGYVDGASAEGVEPYVVVVGGEELGYIQAYDACPWPELCAVADIGPGTAGIDILIADEARIHRGLGPRIIARFLAEVVFARPETVRCVIDPETANAAAIRAYEKAGFRHVATVRIPGERAETCLMALTREEWGSGG